MARSVSVFVISSYVVSGQVGLKAMMPALRALQLEAVSLPSTVLAAHPAAFPDANAAMGAPPGEALSPAQMVQMADWLIQAGALDDCGAVITGYLPSPAHIAAAAQIVTKLKAAHPEMIYCCDPICGDNGALYLPQNVVTALGDTLLPLADMATPNLFELGALTGLPVPQENADKANKIEAETDYKRLIEAAKALPVETVLITSAPAPEGRIASLQIGPDIYRCETARAPRAPHGMGDFFAALYVGLTLTKEPKALGIACATLAQMANRNLETAQLPHGPVVLAQAALTDKLAYPGQHS